MAGMRGMYVVLLSTIMMAGMALGQQTPSASTVCVCRCCYLGDCTAIKGGNGTHTVERCDMCTNEICSARYGSLCGTNQGLMGECYDREALFPKLTCFLLIFIITGLIAFGIAKNHVPMFAAYNLRHFNY
eukprot:Hpha_TRINITY_DN3326_c0_g1::TRINITY_DN3326_c0_g1_i1::g.172387::m.172387